jgi:cell wall-associated NlpC family hydrolase
VLEVGDLILSTTNDPVLSAIGSATGSEVSHASMYIGNGKVIHAKAAGMEELNIHQLMDSCTLCVAYHHRDMNQTKASKILQFLRTAADNHIAFDGWGLIQAAPSQLLASYCDSLMGTARQTCLNSARSILPGTDNNDQFFCSELIFSALKEAGLTISTIQPSFSSTQEAVRLFYDGTLHYVGHLKLQII